MPWSKNDPPILPVSELQSNPHELVNRPKTTKLAKFSDPVWRLPLPAWLGGHHADPDLRTVCLLITAAATSIEAEFSVGDIWWKDTHDAIIKCPDQAALSKSAKDVEHALDALVQRLLTSRFPAFAALSPGQIRTAAGFANLDLPTCLIRHAALTQVVATVNEQLLKVQSKEVPETPSFCLDRDFFNQFDWGDAACQLSAMPATPLRESASARDANARAAGMALELAATRDQEPPKDSRADLANRSEQDARTVTERLLLAAKERPSAQTTLDPEGRCCCLRSLSGSLKGFSAALIRVHALTQHGNAASVLMRVGSEGLGVNIRRGLGVGLMLETTCSSVHTVERGLCVPRLMPVFWQSRCRARSRVRMIRKSSWVSCPPLLHVVRVGF